ncbi:unnamed protein product [Closterium sp. NIES-54]
MSKVLIAEGLGYNLLSVSQLMAKGIHLEADSTTQEFKLFHGKGGLNIGRAVLKNNVFVLDFVPDQGTGEIVAIVNFASWTHPLDLDPDFSPRGFWYSHTIPEAERTQALATIRQEETTSTAAETTSATTATLTAPIASSSTAPTFINDTPQTPAQQLTPSPREILRAIAAMNRKKLRQIDVANAFLYAPVDAEILVELSHRSNAGPNQICQLEKSLYGIKQAPRLWQQHLHAPLIRIGFLQIPHDQGMYRLTKGSDYILLIVYVDDLLYIGSTDALTTWFEGELQQDLTLTVATTARSPGGVVSGSNPGVCTCRPLPLRIRLGGYGRTLTRYLTSPFIPVV